MLLHSTIDRPEHSPHSYFDSTHGHGRWSEDSTMYSQHPNVAISRKRPRVASQHFPDHRTPRATGSYFLDASISSLDAASPSPLVNTDYKLWGGMDTPGAWSEQRLERVQQIDEELDYRQSRFGQRDAQLNWKTSDEILAQETISRDTIPHDESQKWHLGSAAWALTGGLAGKIFNFCWNTTFSGFRAGGGQAYTDYAEVVTRTTPETEENDFWSKRQSFGSIVQVPGSFPRDRKSLEHREVRQARPSCERNDSSWVILEHNDSQEDFSPIRKRSKASVAGFSRSNSSAFQPVQPIRSSASYASPRSGTTSAAIGSRPNSQKRPRPSTASPSRRQSGYFAEQSPMSPELETYQRKKRREDKKQDESIRRLNAQLQDMIREGQEALGSKIEIVDDHSTDEGYYEGDGFT